MVSRLPCCLAVGHCLVPRDTASLGQGSLPASSHFLQLTFAVFAACSTLNTSGHASAVSDACVWPRLDGLADESEVAAGIRSFFAVLFLWRSWPLGVG